MKMTMIMLMLMFIFRFIRHQQAILQSMTSTTSISPGFSLFGIWSIPWPGLESSSGPVSVDVRIAKWPGLNIDPW